MNLEEDIPIDNHDTVSDYALGSNNGMIANPLWELKRLCCRHYRLTNMIMIPFRSLRRSFWHFWMHSIALNGIPGNMPIWALF